MKITVLVENTSKNELQSEHGLSFLIEFQGGRYLLDAGSTDAFMKNANALGEDLENVTACILSHGHYDHGGGFEAYMEAYEEIPLYMMREATGDYYSGKGKLHYIGLPKNLEMRYETRIRWVDSVRTIAEHVYLVPHTTKGLEQIGVREKLYRQVGEQYLADDFRHEMSLVFETEKGLLVFNSCSHGGVKNILFEVQQAFPGREIYAFFGGLHMKGMCDGREICTFSEEAVQEVIRCLKEAGVLHLYTGHCTGEAGYNCLLQYGGEMLHRLYTGKQIELLTYAENEV